MVVVVVVAATEMRVWRQRAAATYGAEMESIFLLRIGSDILASAEVEDAAWQIVEEKKVCVAAEMFGGLARVGQPLPTVAAPLLLWASCA